MLPLPVITVITIARLDIGHHLGRRRAIPIGAAAITGRIHGSSIHFMLDSRVLQPSDPTDDLLAWLDQRLAGESATIAGYQLSAAAGLLEKLTCAGSSRGLRSLAGLGPQPLMDLSARELRGEPLTFQQACAHARIPCSSVDPSDRFAAWCRSDTDLIDHQTQVDAVATWRLVMKRLAALDEQYATIVAAMNEHFVAWLRTTSNAAARLHASDIAVAD